MLLGAQNEDFSTGSQTDPTKGLVLSVAQASLQYAHQLFWFDTNFQAISGQPSVSLCFWENHNYLLRLNETVTVDLDSPFADCH